MMKQSIRSLRITAAWLIFSFACGLGAPAHAQVSGIGVANQPSVYLKVGNALKQLVWNGQTWYWNTGSVIGVTEGIGVVHGGPWAYYVFSDGNVYGVGGLQQWAGSFRSRPSGVLVGQGLGACAGDAAGSRNFTFILGSDFNVWSHDGVAGWFNHGKPSGASVLNRVGATTVHGTRPYLFVIGSDGNLWLHYWTGSAWQWENHGKPAGFNVTASVGVTTISGNRPFAFITAGDGNLWSRSWSGSSWGWHNHGKPGGNNIINHVGVANAGNNGRPYAFVSATDGNLWSQGWHGSAWVWENHGKPGNMSITVPIGATGVGGDRPYAYVMATDGALWQRWWTGSAWAWSSHGAPPP